ncbi:MAG: amidohydrolase family protein [Chloroflexi bacterium]|nr:amidohydrolase family protein [Chloroflexota bacterium]
MLTLDAAEPEAEAVAVADGRIIAVGRRRDMPTGDVIDLDGLIVPGFHDAHIHLLKYARRGSKVDCSHASSIEELQALLRAAPGEGWLRASGYDERRLGRHPTRADLDEVAADRPVRLEHRGLHLDVFNAEGLRQLGIDEPSGQVHYRGEWLSTRMPRPDRHQVMADLRAACEKLLSWGITCVTDASVTNGPGQWELFRDLPVRVVMMAGADKPPGPAGIAKILLDEATASPDDVRRLADRAHEAGQRVAVHASTEGELAMALPALQPGDRIEHGAVIPDSMIEDVRAAGVAVVSQPGLVYERGDVYIADHPPEQRGWLHRARSLAEAGIPYAIGSDAPVEHPQPSLALFAAQRRLTAGGQVLGAHEALTPMHALAAMTREPAHVAGIDDLGVIRPGALADLVVLDADALEPSSPEPRIARLTMSGGRIVWRAKVKA